MAEIAHELANPLAIAQGFAQQLADGDGLDRDERQRAAEAVHRNIRIAMHLLATYRQAARPLDDPITLDLAWVDVSDLVEETVADLCRLLADRTLNVHHDDPEMTMLADRSRIQQALFNLLSNAVKHTDPGTAIHVHTWRDGDRAVVEIADEGRGVAPDMVDRVFDARARGNVDADGLGLGLWIARKIADAHGGSLQLVPAEQRGAVFQLRLPVGNPDRAGTHRTAGSS